MNTVLPNGLRTGSCLLASPPSQLLLHTFRSLLSAPAPNRVLTLTLSKCLKLSSTEEIETNRNSLFLACPISSQNASVCSCPWNSVCISSMEDVYEKLYQMPTPLLCSEYNHLTDARRRSCRAWLGDKVVNIC